MDHRNILTVRVHNKMKQKILLWLVYFTLIYGTMLHNVWDFSVATKQWLVPAVAILYSALPIVVVIVIVFGSINYSLKGLSKVFMSCFFMLFPMIHFFLFETLFFGHGNINLQWFYSDAKMAFVVSVVLSAFLALFNLIYNFVYWRFRTSKKKGVAS